MGFETYTLGFRVQCAQKTQQLTLVLLLFLLGVVVTVFGSEPLVNIKGGVPTERPCPYSFCIPAMIEVVFR